MVHAERAIVDLVMRSGSPFVEPVGAFHHES